MRNIYKQRRDLPRALSWLLVGVVLVLAPPARACGWWGDGEADDSDGAVTVDAQGQPISSEPDQPSALKVPGAMGYGIAVHGLDDAVPYLEATGGLAANSIGQLANLGFAAVIDLGTPPHVAQLHRQETEQMGMRYFNLAEADETGFGAILEDPDNLPLLVFAHARPVLGRMWSAFRRGRGIDDTTARREGRRLGLAEE